MMTTTGKPKVYKLDASPKSLKIKMAVYGKSGVGKTRLASDLGKHFKVFMMSSEFGAASIVSNPNFAQIQDRLDLMDCTSWDDTREAFNYIVENQDKYDWTIVDSLSDINKRIVDDIISKSKDETLSMREWGKVSARLERLIRYLRDLRTNVLFICLSTSEKNELTGEITQLPSLTGRLKEEMPALMDIVGYLYSYESREEAGKIERAVQFVSTPKATGKDRFDKLEFEPADMSHILKKLGLI